MTPAPTTDSPYAAIHDLVAEDEDARACKDISEDACDEQPRNFGVHVVSLSLTKMGDGAVDPKLFLSWLLDLLGAPGTAIAMLVPVRESLSLLPQLVVAGWLRLRPVRKWFWVAGSAGQGACVMAMAGVAATLDGALAGWTIVGLLGLFALARGVSSVASKDVLGKTIAKRRRGQVSGYASTVAGTAVVLLGLGLQVEPGGEQGIRFFVVLLGAGGLLWLIAAGIYSSLREAPGATSGGASALREALDSLRLLAEDRQLVIFLVARALLVSTALMAPFLAVLSRRVGGSGLAELGVLVIASGLASSVSAALWGRAADRSSRRVMARAGGVAALTGVVAAALAHLTDNGEAWASYAFGALYFALSIAHTGVRIGRKTHLVDMANSDNRASYVAVSNTLIGIVLLLGGGAGWLADAAGPEMAVLLFASLAAAGAIATLSLDEVQR